MPSKFGVFIAGLIAIGMWVVFLGIIYGGIAYWWDKL